MSSMESCRHRAKPAQEQSFHAAGGKRRKVGQANPFGAWNVTVGAPGAELGAGGVGVCLAEL